MKVSDFQSCIEWCRTLAGLYPVEVSRSLIYTSLVANGIEPRSSWVDEIIGGAI